MALDIKTHRTDDKIPDHNDKNFAELAAQIKASDAIQRKWSEMQGPRSPLGLPLSRNFVVEKVGNDYRVIFRGGEMRVLDGNPQQIIAIPNRQVVVTFEGYGLVMRQEKGDEIYGQIACVAGSNGYGKQFDIPIATVGPSDDDRVRLYGTVLWEGPPINLNIGAKMIEHDDGNADAMRAEVRKRVNQILDKAAQVGLGAGGVVGEAAGAYANESAVDGDFASWIKNAIGDGIAKILGLGDDEYDYQGLTITADQMMGDLSTRTFRCWNDPRTIEYTHQIVVNGVDDGGDHGQIALLFRVRSK